MPIAPAGFSCDKEKAMTEDLYSRLREFLHSFPGGYPTTPDGVEIKILKKLFAPDDAELYLSLKKEPEELGAIARRLGRDEAQLGEKLEDMAKRGLVFRNRDVDRVLYKAYQFFVGIIEAQINRVDPELTQLIDEYFPYLGATGLQLETKQMRIIPAGTAVDAKTTVASYNRMREMVKDEDLIAVAPCICRQMAENRGHKCEHSSETCLSFGEHAQFYIDNGIARKISKDELLKLLDAVEKEGLVVCTSNTEDLSITCCCCPCCCGILRGIKLLPQASLMTSICYQAKIDPELCVQCGDCLERCPMEAISELDQTMEVSTDKCIGCGLCVSVCPEEAISLRETPRETPPFHDGREMAATVSKERGLL
jgi:H+/Na+-translocating ferredoxin:NAD+ oxidoreductase subunit B